MARICMVCGKCPQVGYNVSHANNRTKKWIYPNVHRIRFTYPNCPSKVHAGKVCTKCVKAQKVQKII